MKPFPLFAIFLSLFLPAIAHAAEADTILKFLEHPILDSGTTLEEVQKFTESRVPRMPENPTLDSWKAEAAKRRADVLDKIVFRGGAVAWRDRPAKVEWQDTIERSVKATGLRAKSLAVDHNPQRLTIDACGSTFYLCLWTLQRFQLRKTGCCR